jgi:hypothetical protein
MRVPSIKDVINGIIDHNIYRIEVKLIEIEK